MNPLFRQIRNAFRVLRRKYHRLVHIDLDIALQKRRLVGYTDGIIEVVDGARERGARRFAIFVTFPTGGALDRSVIRALEAMNRAEIDVLVVSNAPLSPETREQLRPIVWRIMLRKNIGFDFGAYKDAALYLERERPDLERLLILNDSVFYSSVGLDAYFTSLLGPEDVIAAFENWGEGYHMQSFGISCSGHVFSSPIFRAYWRDYLPVGNRIYAIEFGEKRLSDACLKAARNSRVIYSVVDLRAAMREDASEDRVEDFIVPLHWRATMASLGAGTFRIKDRCRVLADIVNTTSPIHSGAYLFPRYLACPIYKKDLVYRQRFQFHELAELCAKTLPPDEYDEFMLMLRQKADNKRLSPPDLAKYEIGVK